MASGHASRIDRPNTWLLRPGCDMQKSPCQHGAVHTWHNPEDFGTAAIPAAFWMAVAPRGQSVTIG